jgi:hypothetical protein
MIINMIHETKNLLSLKLISFLVGLRTYQHPCSWYFYTKLITMHVHLNIKLYVVCFIALSVMQTI